MSYFKRFPLVVDYKVDGKSFDAMDITRRTGLSNEYIKNEQLSFEYYVQDGETPEMLADRVYDDASMYWTIMFFNNLFDINTDWPLDSVSFERYMDRVYGSTKYDIRFYRAASTGLVVESDYPEYDRIPVTNYEYELELNDAKRTIRLPFPEVANSMVSQHKKKIRE